MAVVGECAGSPTQLLLSSERHNREGQKSGDKAHSVARRVCRRTSTAAALAALHEFCAAHGGGRGEGRKLRVIKSCIVSEPTNASDTNDIRQNLKVK